MAVLPNTSNRNTFNLPTNGAVFQQPAQNVERPKSKVWLNIGYEVNGRFVSLPLGVSLDNMKKVPVSGQNEDWVKFRAAQNALLDALLAHGLQMEPGAEEALNLEVRIRHTSEELEVVNNEYQVDLASLLAPRPLAAE